MKYLTAPIVALMLCLPSCGLLDGGGEVEAAIQAAVAEAMASVDVRVDEGEAFDTALKAEIDSLKTRLPEIVATAAAAKIGGGLDLGDGTTSEEEFGLGALLLWVLRNWMRSRNAGTAATLGTLLTGSTKPQAGDGGASAG